MMYKNFLLSKDDSPNTVSCSRNMLTIKFADIFMSVRTIIITLIFVQSQVKLCAVLNYRFIKRR